MHVGPKLTEGAAEYACQEENRRGRKRDAAKLKRKQGKKNGKDKMKGRREFWINQVTEAMVRHLEGDGH